MRFAVAQTAEPGITTAAITRDDKLADLDPELLSNPPAERDTDRPLNPSRLGGQERAPDSPLETGDGSAAQRGRVIHRLLELLPDIEAQDRSQAANRLMAHMAADMSDNERAAIGRDVLAILNDEAFAGLFGPDSRAEVPIIGRLGDVVIAGQVDRLVIGPEYVDIVDFKSNRRPPTGLDDIPEAYLRQMAAYQSVLRQIYPQREVRCLLLWTAKPLLQDIPQDLLDAYAP